MGAATDTLPGILAIFNNVAPGREAEFEEWFQHEHLAERIAVPGFLIGRRHEAISGQPRYFNFYVTQSVEVLKSAAYLGRLDEPTPMTRTVMSEIFKDMIRTVCRRTFRLGAMRGAGVVTVRFGERPAETALKAAIERLMRDKAVACGEVWRAADPLEFPVSMEERLRGGDRKIEACLLVETLRVPEAEKIAVALANEFPSTEIGVYQLLCEITANGRLVNVKAHALRSIPAIMHARSTSRFNGITIVLIEQNAKQALQISDGLVLEQGQPASKTQRRQILADPRIAQLFLGGGLAPVGGVS